MSGFAGLQANIYSSQMTPVGRYQPIAGQIPVASKLGASGQEPPFATHEKSRQTEGHQSERGGFGYLSGASPGLL